MGQTNDCPDWSTYISKAKAGIEDGIHHFWWDADILPDDGLAKLLRVDQ